VVGSCVDVVYVKVQMREKHTEQELSTVLDGIVCQNSECWGKYLIMDYI
jgi:formamidopyrimidine-DNA glycosylase